MNKKVVNKFFSENVEYKVLAITLISALVLFMCLFLFVQTMNAVKKNAYIGKDTAALSVLPITGKGEVKVVPNIASFSISVIGRGTLSEEAQSNAAVKNNRIMEYLRSIGIPDTDIKTTQISVNPKYSYEPMICERSVCPPGKQVQDGYEATESITIKIRKTQDVGEITAGLTQSGADNVYGPNFITDDEEVYKRQARELAIEDARKQAYEIADKLGIKIGRIVGYHENSSGMPYYATDMMMSARKEASVVPEVAPGEDTITSQVTISFEIK